MMFILSLVREAKGMTFAKASPQTYKCSYEYGEANRSSDGTTTTTVYEGDLTFELNNRTLSGSTRFSISFRQNGWTIAPYSEEAEWTGKRQGDTDDCDFTTVAGLLSPALTVL